MIKRNKTMAVIMSLYGSCWVFCVSIVQKWISNFLLSLQSNSCRSRLMRCRCFRFYFNKKKEKLTNVSSYIKIIMRCINNFLFSLLSFFFFLHFYSFFFSLYSQFDFIVYIKFSITYTYIYIITETINSIYDSLIIDILR